MHRRISKKHLESLNSLHGNYVLVPADKAANNVIVVCKKYYLEVVTNEITATTTYDHSDSYDFSTLYTSIPHDSLKHALKCLIQEAYKVRDNTFLVVRSNG